MNIPVAHRQKLYREYTYRRLYSQMGYDTRRPMQIRIHADTRVCTWLQMYSFSWMCATKCEFIVEQQRRDATKQNIGFSKCAIHAYTVNTNTLDIDYIQSIHWLYQLFIIVRIKHDWKYCGKRSLLIITR